MCVFTSWLSDVKVWYGEWKWMECSYLAFFLLMLALRLVCVVIWLRNVPCRKLVLWCYLYSIDCFSCMNSSAGATEGKLGNIMVVYVEDTVEPSGLLELLWDQATAKRIAAALVAGWELLLLPLRFLSQCVVMVLVSLLVWLTSDSARKTSCSQLGQLPKLPEKQLAVRFWGGR